jgi:hypothetical protein
MKKEKLSFTGHDSFHCRSFWLKKGYDFVKNGGQFNDNAVVELGVGRNMVNAVRYWMRCFGLTDENDKLQPDEFGKFLEYATSNDPSVQIYFLQ